MNVYRQHDIERAPPPRWRLVRVDAPGYATLWYIEERWRFLWWSWWWRFGKEGHFEWLSEKRAREGFAMFLAQREGRRIRTVVDSA